MATSSTRWFIASTSTSLDNAATCEMLRAAAPERMLCDACAGRFQFWLEARQQAREAGTLMSGGSAQGVPAASTPCAFARGHAAVAEGQPVMMASASIAAAAAGRRRATEDADELSGETEAETPETASAAASQAEAAAAAVAAGQ